LKDQVRDCFRRSTRCDTGTCVEVSVTDVVQVRNSTAPEHLVTFTKEEWSAFIAGVRLGEFEVS
jgi:uncharacterized protein DUF397